MEDEPLQAPDGALFTGAWADGRPKRWPTMQLRVRGRPFDIYCEHPSDVTLDAFGIPVVAGRTAGRSELDRGWMSVDAVASPAPRPVV